MTTTIPRMALDANSERAFQQALRFAIDRGPYEAKKAVDWAAWSYVQSARKITPTAKKTAKRRVVPLQSGFWGAVRLSQTRPPRVLPIREARSESAALRSPLAKVPRVGSGKLSWYGSFRGLMRPAGKQGPDTSSARQVGGHLSPAIEIVNRLRYLLKIAPDVDAQSKAKAAKQIVIRTERYLDKHGFRHGGAL